MSSALDVFEKSLIEASRELYTPAARRQPVRTPMKSRTWPRQRLLGASGAARMRPALVSRPHKRLAAIVVALAIAGCGVAAATGAFSGSSARLAVGLVDCYYGTGTTNSQATTPHNSVGLVLGMHLLAGQTPTTACRQMFNQYPPRVLRETGLKPLRHPALIACRKNATATSVFIASGNADQCQRLGLTPLPHSFASASASVRALAKQLNRMYLSRDCWRPQAFAQLAQITLNRDGFTGWRVVSTKPHKNVASYLVGQCAALDLPEPNSGDSIESLDGTNRTLNIGRTIPHSINRLITRDDDKLVAEQWSTCYRPATIHQIVEKAFAASGMTPKIAITTNPNAGAGSRFSWGTRAEALHYQAGCLNLFDSWPTPNDRTVLVWFIARNGTHIPAFTGSPPPLADYRY